MEIDRKELIEAMAMAIYAPDACEVRRRELRSYEDAATWERVRKEAEAALNALVKELPEVTYTEKTGYTNAAGFIESEDNGSELYHQLKEMASEPN